MYQNEPLSFVSDDKKQSRFLSVLRHLSPSELPSLKEKKLSKRAQKRIAARVMQKQAELSRNVKPTDVPSVPTQLPMRVPPADYRTRFRGTTPRRRVLSTVSGLCAVVCIASAGIVYRQDIGLFLETVFKLDTSAQTDPIGSGQVDLPPSPPSVDGTEDIADTEPAMQTDLFSLSVTDVVCSGTSTALCLKVRPTDGAFNDIIRADHYTVSLKDPDTGRWYLKIDRFADSGILFSPESDYEAMIVLDEYRLDINPTWIWKLELQDLYTIANDGTDTIIDGYAAVEFDTDLADYSDIPQDKVKPADASETMNLSITAQTQDGDTTALTLLMETEDKALAEHFGIGLFYETQTLEKWDGEKSGEWVTVQTDGDIVHNPVSRIYAADFDFFVSHKNDADYFPESVVSFAGLEDGIYRLTLQNFTSVFEVPDSKGLLQMNEDHIEPGSVSVLFTVNN